ncbi:MAG: hypothetical protein HY820_29345 [Acidobacteria bacterium]|nr:hypothetical protein [Acidobacteriota bacterium]
MTAEGKSTIASITALASVIAASTCCLPLGLFVAAAGTAGASAYLQTARVWLMPVSLVLLGVAFHQAYARRNQCTRRSTWSKAVLWISAAVVLAMFLFPQWVAITLAKLVRS